MSVRLCCSHDVSALHWRQLRYSAGVCMHVYVCTCAHVCVHTHTHMSICCNITKQTKKAFRAGFGVCPMNLSYRPKRLWSGLRSVQYVLKVLHKIGIWAEVLTGLSFFKVLACSYIWLILEWVRRQAWHRVISTVIPGQILLRTRRMEKIGPSWLVFLSQLWLLRIAGIRS